MIRPIHLLFTSFFLFVLLFAYHWLDPFAPALERGTPVVTAGSTTPVDIMRPLTGFSTTVIASGLEVPWGMVFTSPERMIVTERPGRVRVLERSVLSPDPLHVFSEVSVGGEEGLMSVTLHPQYTENRYIYFSLAYKQKGEMYLKVVRTTDEGTRLGDIQTILDRTPAAQFHAGSRIGFGPDGKLYVTTGDATERALADDMDSLAGKTLRMNDDGSVPSDNPFPGSLIYSIGHRNAQGMDWNDDTQVMYQSEHGPSLFDGPAGGDEVNRIVAGGDYGWPSVSHERTQEGTVAPLHVFTPAEAPGSLLVHSGKMFPELRGNLLFGALGGKGIVRVVLDERGEEVIVVEKLGGIEYGRIRDVIEGPDGVIYFSTSNRDGRGEPTKEDDQIFKLERK